MKKIRWDRVIIFLIGVILVSFICFSLIKTLFVGVVEQFTNDKKIVASTSLTVPLYDFDYNEIIQIKRGEEVTILKDNIINNEQEYSQVKYDKNEYYILSSNLVDDINDAVLEKSANRNKRFTECQRHDEEGNTFFLVHDTKDAEKPELVHIRFNFNEKNFLLNKEGHLVFGSKKYFLKDDELWQSTRGKDGKWHDGKVKEKRENYELIKQAFKFVKEKNLEHYFHEDIS